MRMRRWGIVAAVMLLFVMAVYYWHIYDPTDYDALYARCSELELGMSRSEVIAVMGEEPKEIRFRNRESNTVEIWMYDNRPGISTPMYCSFDSADGTAIRILCGEQSLKHLEAERESDSLEH